ncbi:hypothetical protein ASPZODRAFT_19720 [Penicilliopsis zonata CBS 506.65]|uniref:Mediator of RNA polymerase II transcription subunit 14 n=1 Tax=Penicilliopsis zonata CBS 506.65 TaxID=1073090 RepID=A0A1L9S834_9EURO|nr:hypothetical protein ASPZODRAFT_19720 [Penicilliopsis zonata CBS 506.65]OJJ43316.1 hypothetical protein ASPZODRAFT_19720 [Penicilliopsis zonata CBS 506.65]
MPGMIMDKGSAVKPRLNENAHEASNGVASSTNHGEKIRNIRGPNNGSIRADEKVGENGAVHRFRDQSTLSLPRPELEHITHGFFPFAQLVSRSAQKCWNDLSDLITELADMQVTTQDQASSSPTVGGKLTGAQSPGNVEKKLQLLNFAHRKRGEFIKLLVLSQWSRQSSDVSKLIDLQGFIRTRHMTYNAAIQCVGDMKIDLVRAQVANPDLNTALEILFRGGISSMPDLGYDLPKPLTAKKTLKKLQKINRLISARLALHSIIPQCFQTYRIHDGRVTFFVPGEFELDLSIGEESATSQFFFVDIRFNFSPSSPIPKGRLLNELDIKINEILRDGNLTGCFNYLHGLVLTNKVNVLFKQAAELSRGAWSESLRVELLHRTLVLHYWALRPGAKSWIEVGIKRGRSENHIDTNLPPGTPYIGLRWMRDGKIVDSKNVRFNMENLSMEDILRSVIALHISHILHTAYSKLIATSLFASRALSLRGQLSGIEPGDCRLDVQLTVSKHLRVSIEPASGAIILSAIPTTLDRFETVRNPERSASDAIFSRVSRIRCIAAMEEVECDVKMLGLEVIGPKGLRLDIRRIFFPPVLRVSFFSHRSWGRDWIAAATSSMDGDHWWVVQLQSAVAISSRPASDTDAQGSSILPAAQMISKAPIATQQGPGATSFADLGLCLSGMIAVHANVRFLAEMEIPFSPPLSKLQVGPHLEIPDVIIRYNVSKLPLPLCIVIPTGLRRMPLIKDAVRLVFGGLDAQSESVTFVAYGQLARPIIPLNKLALKPDHSLVFKRNSTSFAMRLSTHAGQSVIVELLERLQRLEYALAIVESLHQRRIPIYSFSLSRISFGYSTQKDLLARIHIQTYESSGVAHDPVNLKSRTEPLFRTSLDIHFDHPNPHRRIQESLSSILNQDAAGAGFQTVVELLPITFPLLQALDSITSIRDRLRIHVTVRNAKTYVISYPRYNFRFLLTAKQHFSRVHWILKEMEKSRNRSDQDQLVSCLQERLYRGRGDGWKGLGNGAIVDYDKAGNLLTALDACFRSMPELSDVNAPSGQASMGFGVATKQNAPGIPDTPGGLGNHAPKSIQDTSIITID